MNKLEDVLKALLKNGLEISPKQRSANCLKPAYNTWEMKYLSKKESMCKTPKKHARSNSEVTAIENIQRM